MQTIKICPKVVAFILNCYPQLLLSCYCCCIFPSTGVNMRFIHIFHSTMLHRATRSEIFPPTKNHKDCGWQKIKGKTILICLFRFLFFIRGVILFLFYDGLSRISLLIIILLCCFDKVTSFLTKLEKRWKILLMGDFVISKIAINEN